MACFTLCFFSVLLLEAGCAGAGALTDAGTAYKLCRNDAIWRLLPLLIREINTASIIMAGLAVSQGYEKRG